MNEHREALFLMSPYNPTLHYLFMPSSSIFQPILLFNIPSSLNSDSEISPSFRHAAKLIGSFWQSDRLNWSLLLSL